MGRIQNLKGAYKFMVPEDIKSFKVSMEQSPYTLFDYQTAVTQFLPTYMVIDCYVSKSGNENYLTVYQQTINPKNKNPDTKVLVKNLFVDGDFMNRLYSLQILLRKCRTFSRLRSKDNKIKTYKTG